MAAKGGRVGGGFAIFTRVLDVHKDGLAVARFGNAGDLTGHRAHQEAAQRGAGGLGTHHRVLRLGRYTIAADVGQRAFATVAHLAWQRGQHHAVGHVGEFAVVGLQPQQASSRLAEPHAIRAGEVVVFRQARGVDVGRHGGARTKQVHVPGEARRSRVAVGIGKTHDVAVRVATLGGFGGTLGVVVVTGVGSIGAGQRTCRVVGQRQVHVTVLGVDGGPLGAVHFGGACGVGSVAGVDENVGLVGEGVLGVAGRNVVQAELEFHPHTRAVGLELGHIQLAVVHVFVASGQATGGISSIPDLGGHKLVEVLVLCVVTHVPDQWFAHHHRAQAGAFVAEAAQCRTLLGRGGGAERIDLDHPAVGVGGIAVIGGGIGALHFGIPAAVLVVCGVGRDGGPEFAARSCNPITAEGCQLFGAAFGVVGGGDTAEVTGPVFFTREVGAPGRGAVGAVVDSAPGGVAIGRVFGDHELAESRGARQGHRRECVHAAVELGRLVEGPGGARLFHVDHTHTVQVELTLDFFGHGAYTAHAGLTGGVQVQRGDGFVVHHQQAACACAGVPFVVATCAEVGHAVMVVTSAAVVGGGIIGAVVFIGSHVVGDRVTQAVQHTGGVTHGHDQRVGQALGHRIEVERHGGRCRRWSRGWRGRRGRCRSGRWCSGHIIVPATTGRQHHGAGGAAHTQAEQVAAAQTRRNHAVKRRVGGGVGANVIGVDDGAVGGNCRVHGEAIS